MAEVKSANGRQGGNEEGMDVMTKKGIEKKVSQCLTEHTNVFFAVNIGKVLVAYTAKEAEGCGSKEGRPPYPILTKPLGSLRGESGAPRWKSSNIKIEDVPSQQVSTSKIRN